MVSSASSVPQGRGSSASNVVSNIKASQMERGTSGRVLTQKGAGVDTAWETPAASATADGTTLQDSGGTWSVKRPVGDHLWPIRYGALGAVETVESLAQNQSHFGAALPGDFATAGVFTGENLVEWTTPVAFTVVECSLRVSANTCDQISTWRWRKNGADAGSAVTLAAATTGTVLLGSLSLAAGDRFCWTCVIPAGSGAVSLKSAVVQVRLA